MSVEVVGGDCREVLDGMSGFTACVTDPPYGLGFMGKGWDHSVPGPDYWRAVKDACVPGAMMLAFGGTRTYHRLTCAIEDAGWEIRDCIMWVYGSGFPKSHNISKSIDKAAGAENIIGTKSDRWTGKGNSLNFSTDRPQEECKITAPATDAARLWDGWGTALKPAYEPIIVAMKPLDGTFAGNAVEHGVAGLNVDGGRIPTQDTPRGSGNNLGYHGNGSGTGGNVTPPQGRWPANLIHDGSQMVLDLFPVSSTTGKRSNQSKAAVVGGTQWGVDNHESKEYTDSGTAARFFYCAKASKAERGEGNDHPTVKPLALMRYLLTLVTMPERNLILDPFCGSGTTGVAAAELGLDCVCIDKDEHSCEIARARTRGVGKTNKGGGSE